jgi:predicted Zn-dependent protease
MKGELALAYNNENRPDDAIEILHELIKKNKEPHGIMGERMPKMSAHYGLDSAYYRMLAESYQLKKDSDSQTKALNKMKQAEAMEARLKPAEQAREERQKKRERDSILQ